jgi:eukaryotic-like serine/threonine-protein kinase
VCPRDATPRADQLTTAADPLLGEILGRTYRIVRVLGEGGMARLYEAEHLRIDARYAVKVIHDDLARDADLLARFEREARAAARIHSEHVVRMVDVLRTQDNRPCLVTELLEGEDLQARLDRVTRLDVAEAIPIARQICRAVAAAHAVGVVHRDLKPANVFLCRTAGAPSAAPAGAPGPSADPRQADATIVVPLRAATERQGPEDPAPGGAPVVKVFDFGVAKIDDDEKLTRTDAIMGTAAYMAPEQARRAADAGPLADVYSVAAVLYHMVTGAPPYGNVPAMSRLAMVLHEEPARPRTLEPSIPDGVEAVIQHAMARDPSARIASARELEAQLAAFDRRSIAPGRGGAAGRDPVATEILVRARVARPLAGFLAGASSIAAGAWLAGLLGAIVSPSSGGEHALLGVMSLAAVAGVALLHARALRPSWRSPPATLQHIRPTARALVAGGLTFGALELVTVGTAAVIGAPTLGVATRLMLAGVAAGLGLAWQTLRLDDRLRRRIG